MQLLHNPSSRENEEVQDTKIDEMVRAGHSFVGGPETVVHVRTVSGRVVGVHPARAAAVIQEGGAYVPGGEVERMRENKEFSESTLGALAAAPLGFDDWMFAGAGGSAMEAMGLVPEGRREEIQSANPFIWHASGLTPTAIAILMSGGTYGAARAAGGAALASAKTAARQAGQNAATGSIIEAGKNLAKAGYYGAKATTVSPFNMATASDLAGNWAARGADRAISHLAGRATAQSLKNHSLARYIGETGSKVASGITRGLVEGGVWGAGEGLSESMLGPPDQVAETVLEHMKTNALIGMAFGGAVGSVIPALSGAKRAMLGGARVGSDAMGWATDRSVDKLRPYLLHLARQTGEFTEDQITAYEKLLQPGHQGDSARREMINLIKDLDKHSTHTARQIEALLLIEDLRQMSDVKGHSLGKILDNIQQTDRRKVGDPTIVTTDEAGEFTETYSKQGARTKRERFDPKKPMGQQKGLWTRGDVGVDKDAVPPEHLDAGVGVNIEDPIAKTYSLPGVNTLLDEAQSVFNTTKTALLEIAERNPRLNANYEITKLVKEVMDMEANFYKSMFSSETKNQFIRNLRRNNSLPQKDAPRLTKAERNKTRLWMRYWRALANPESNEGKHVRKQFEDAANRQGMLDIPYEVAAPHLLRTGKVDLGISDYLLKSFDEYYDEFANQGTYWDDVIGEVDPRPRGEKAPWGQEDLRAGPESNALLHSKWYDRIVMDVSVVDEPLFSSEQRDVLFEVLKDWGREGKAVGIDEYQRTIWELIKDVAESRPGLIANDAHARKLAKGALDAGKEYIGELAELRTQLKKKRPRADFSAWEDPSRSPEIDADTFAADRISARHHRKKLGEFFLDADRGEISPDDIEEAYEILLDLQEIVSNHPRANYAKKLGNDLDTIIEQMKRAKEAPSLSKQYHQAVDYVTTKGNKVTIKGLGAALGLKPGEAKATMLHLVEGGLVIRKGNRYKRSGGVEQRVEGPVEPARRFNFEELEDNLRAAADDEDPRPIIDMAKALGVKLDLPKEKGKLKPLDPEHMGELRDKRNAGAEGYQQVKYYEDTWGELTAAVDRAVARGEAQYGKLGDIDNELGLRNIYDHYVNPLPARGPRTSMNEGRPKQIGPGHLDSVLELEEGYHQSVSDLVKATVHRTAGWESKSAKLTADLYHYLEQLSTLLHDRSKYGILQAAPAQTVIQETIITEIRKKLKDRKLWLGQAAAKDRFDKVAGEFQNYRDQVVSDFTVKVGDQLVASEDKVLSYIASLNKHNIRPSSSRLKGYMDTGIELLNYIHDNFEPVNLSQIAREDPEVIGRFMEKWRRLGLGEVEIPEEMKARLAAARAKGNKEEIESIEKEEWSYRLNALIKSFEGKQLDLAENLARIEEDYPLAKLFMNANASSANLSQMTSELGRGGIAGFMAYAVTGSPMASAAAGAGVGVATMGQNPVRMANFLHLLSSFKKATDDYLEEGVDAWRKDSLPDISRARGWEKKARQMLLMSPRAVTGDIKETQKEMRRKSGEEKSKKYWTDRATKAFASEMSREQYIEARESLTKLVMSPSLMNHFLDKSTEAFEDTPDLREAMRKSIKGKLQSAHSTMPKGTRVGFGAPMIEPTTLELREWGATLQILNSPLDAMFSSMMSGTLTPEMVKTFKKNWPQLHTQLIEKAMISMNNPEYGPMSQQQRMMLNILMEGQFLNPSVAERLLQNYREEEGKKQGGGPQAAAPRMMKRETEQMITAMESPVEQILA